MTYSPPLIYPRVAGNTPPAGRLDFPGILDPRQGDLTRTQRAFDQARSYAPHPMVSGDMIIRLTREFGFNRPSPITLTVEILDSSPVPTRQNARDDQFSTGICRKCLKCE